MYAESKLGPDKFQTHSTPQTTPERVQLRFCLYRFADAEAWSSRPLRTW
jgi:hypothetical protein